MSLRTVFLFTFFLILAVALVGCKSEPRPVRQQPEPLQLPSEVTLDFEGLADAAPEGEPGAGLDDVLFLVSDASAMNFTYSKEVGRELAAARVELEGTEKLDRGAIEGFLEDLLGAHGFELKTVGPASIRMWQVATRP
jgi:hypothetical protein